MITVKKLEKNDLPKYKYWLMPKHKYHEFNGPYFKKKTNKEVEKYIEYLKIKLFKEDFEINFKLIIFDDKIIGELSWYWKSKETLWLEIGIIIFDEKYWGKGIGFLALKKWINILFKEKKDIIRIGLTTWSGNIGMIKLSEKLGLKKEAEYKKARIVNGVYYDSVSYGILREEWIA